MSENNSKRYRIDKITQELKAYFNYGSELAKDFADFAI